MYEIVRIVPENERPKKQPVPPKPTCVSSGGTKEQWDRYWVERDAYYHGFELRWVD